MGTRCRAELACARGMGSSYRGIRRSSIKNGGKSARQHDSHESLWDIEHRLSDESAALYPAFFSVQSLLWHSLRHIFCARQWFTMPSDRVMIQYLKNMLPHSQYSQLVYIILYRGHARRVSELAWDSFAREQVLALVRELVDLHSFIFHILIYA
ncbi:hypothetical protein EI94DRAFT_790359 [Lactarius quietus]|nr:hypothetical protein EI94DRAFT_790359 [Lactarius quietus]